MWSPLIIMYLIEHSDAEESYLNAPTGVPTSPTTILPNSCLGQSDTSNILLKLGSSDDDPIINAACSNQWTIINMQQDNEWESYFTSMRKYHKEVLGPIKDDHVNWQEWLTVDIERFIVSPDCSVCDDGHELNSMYGNASGINTICFLFNNGLVISFEST